MGSHPRVREKHERYLTNRDLSGITPASAGKTTIHGSILIIFQYHPRVCGKNCLAPPLELSRIGSHPRKREKPFRCSIPYGATGITPACAGKTYHKLLWYEQDQDHSRVCGKNKVAETTTERSLGSLPRVREKQYRHDGQRPGHRITPACAGKTLHKSVT